MKMDKADNAKNTTKDNHATDELHVLIVDDEPMVRDIVTGYLTKDGHTVETATNGLDGLEKFHSGEFDVVITDRNMPKMNGDKLASAIKQVAPEKPVIMVTGTGRMMETTVLADVDFIVNKPATRTEFQYALERVRSE